MAEPGQTEENLKVRTTADDIRVTTYSLAGFYEHDLWLITVGWTTDRRYDRESRWLKERSVSSVQFTILYIIATTN
jgi:hypothetical protein